VPEDKLDFSTMRSRLVTLIAPAITPFCQVETSKVNGFKLYESEVYITKMKYMFKKYVREMPFINEI